jgi:hypothetical protein
MIIPAPPVIGRHFGADEVRAHAGDSADFAARAGEGVDGRVLRIGVDRRGLQDDADRRGRSAVDRLPAEGAAVFREAVVAGQQRRLARLAGGWCFAVKGEGDDVAGENGIGQGRQVVVGLVGHACLRENAAMRGLMAGDCKVPVRLRNLAQGVSDVERRFEQERTAGVRRPGR